MTNQCQMTELITPSADKQFSDDSEDDLHSGFLSQPSGPYVLQCKQKQSCERRVGKESKPVSAWHEKCEAVWGCHCFLNRVYLWTKAALYCS